MGKPTGFLETPRRAAPRRPVALRLTDWREVYESQNEATVRAQAGRCMDCGIPFCHQACPLGNLIPEWNDLVYRGRFDDALERLEATNNFPEFTGRLCPAPCESACVVAIADEAVTIERTEYEIIERAYAEDRVVAQPAPHATGHSVAVVGSGPAGLACAQQLARAGHAVVVYERQEAIGGLLRYGIPEFKMEKSVLDRRLGQLVAEGVTFVTSVSIGADGQPTVNALRATYDAVVLAVGSTRPRQLGIEGSDLAGVLFAMDYLKPSNRHLEGEPLDATCDARGRDVVILGGGDTGADCLGTALRQGARSVRQLEIMARPPDERPDNQPWPTMPLLYKVTSAHEEGGEREYGVETLRFVGDDVGRVRALVARDAEGREREYATQLVLIAAGFVGPELAALASDGPLPTTARDTIQVTADWRCAPATNELGAVFACGDAVRGQSLIVWAIAEGRAAAAAVDAHLCGTTTLPAPLEPYQQLWG